MKSAKLLFAVALGTFFWAIFHVAQALSWSVW